MKSGFLKWGIQWDAYPEKFFQTNSFLCVWSLKYLTSCGILGWSVMSGTHTHTHTCSQQGRTKDHHLKWKSRSGSKSATFGLVARLHGTHGSKEPRIHVYTSCQGSLMWPQSTWDTHTWQQRSCCEVVLYISLFITHYLMYCCSLLLGQCRGGLRLVLHVLCN